jgi:TRAP-type C4-dicarboxylate transport system permease small subunit
MTESAGGGPNLGDPTLGTADDAANLKLSDYGFEDWLAFALFWLLAGIGVLQFVTRYILNDSLAWTEEIARYVLMCLTFVGGGMAVRRFTHIHVEFFYVYLPRSVALVLSMLVDVVRIAFFGYATWLSVEITLVMRSQRMVVIDWPMSIVFGICTAGFLIMTLRAIQVTVVNWRTGTSPLVRVHVEGRHQ